MKLGCPTGAKMRFLKFLGHIPVCVRARPLWSVPPWQRNDGPVEDVFIWTVTAFYARVIRKGWLYWAVQKNLVKGCRQKLDCYCVSCELLSTSIADALWFVNIVCLPLITERNAHEICLAQECLQIVRCLLWKQTTTHSLRNNNKMVQATFDQILLNSPVYRADMRADDTW